MTNPNPESGDVNQSEIIEEGMQGADGNVNANGLDPDMAARHLNDLQENLETLRGPSTGTDQTDDQPQD